MYVCCSLYLHFLFNYLSIPVFCIVILVHDIIELMLVDSTLVIELTSFTIIWCLVFDFSVSLFDQFYHNIDAW